MNEPRQDPAKHLDATPGLERGPRNMFDFNKHERRILAPLILAGFFENYDTSVLTLGNTAIAGGLGVDVDTLGIGFGIIRIAALLSVPLLRLADRWGRRTLLIVSLALFTLATGATALAWSLIAFVAFQSVARVFLATENALASIVIAEEVRPDRRGAGLSLLGIVAGTAGGIVILLNQTINATPVDWRLFYLFALLPLLLVAWLRRNMRETQAFEVAKEQDRIQTKLWPHVGPQYRGRLALVVIIAAGFGAVQTPAFFYASELAQDTYGWTSRFTVIVLTSGLLGFIGFYVGGRVSDRLGRKPVTALAVLCTAVGTILIFTEVRSLFTPGWYLLVFSLATFQAVSFAYLAELFPTEMRATLTAFIIASQIAAGSLVLVVFGGLAGTYSTSVMMLTLGIILAVGTLLIIGLPETRGADVVHEDSKNP